MQDNPADKVAQVMAIFKKCKVDEWAKQLQQNYFKTALQHLEDTAVVSARKKPLMELAEYLMVRES
jgi:geranylgeranyl diphosphate synthase type II